VTVLSLSKYGPMRQVTNLDRPSLRVGQGNLGTPVRGSVVDQEQLPVVFRLRKYAAYRLFDETGFIQKYHDDRDERTVTAVVDVMATIPSSGAPKTPARSSSVP